MPSLTFSGPTLPFISQRSFGLVGILLVLTSAIIFCIVQLIKQIRLQQHHNRLVDLSLLPPAPFLDALFHDLARRYPNVQTHHDLLATRGCNASLIALYQSRATHPTPDTKKKLATTLQAYRKQRTQP